MKPLIFILLLCYPLIALSQSETDSSKYEVLSREIYNLKTSNETLLNSLEITTQTLNELVRDKRVSDQTKWNVIKRNITGSVQLYKVLSDDIINLKSRMTDEDYQGYIKFLGSVQDGPLGFSFQDVIIQSATTIGIFEKKSSLDRFIGIAKNVVGSPLLSDIPFMSTAVSVSSSILNIAYSSSMNDPKVDLAKVKKFENELNKYLSFYTTLDKANLQNQSSNADRKVMLETLQQDLLANLKKDAERLQFSIPKRKEIETMDAYLNRVLGQFSATYSNTHLVNIENKYKNDKGDINYAELLLKEQDAKIYNNNINALTEFAKKYTLYYGNFFDVAANYQNNVIEAIDLAKGNGIIQGKRQMGRELNANQVYEEIIKNLKDKKNDRDNGIINSINIAELKQKMELVEEFKLI